MPLPVEFKLGVVQGLWGWPPELVSGAEDDILTETRGRSHEFMDDKKCQQQQKLELL